MLSWSVLSVIAVTTFTNYFVSTAACQIIPVSIRVYCNTVWSWTWFYRVSACKIHKHGFLLIVDPIKIIYFWSQANPVMTSWLVCKCLDIRIFFLIVYFSYDPIQGLALVHCIFKSSPCSINEITMSIIFCPFPFVEYVIYNFKVLLEIFHTWSYWCHWLFQVSVMVTFSKVLLDIFQWRLCVPEGVYCTLWETRCSNCLYKQGEY